jgi:hypothetical protein
MGWETQEQDEGGKFKLVHPCCTSEMCNNSTLHNLYNNYPLF